LVDVEGVVFVVFLVTARQPHFDCFDILVSGVFDFFVVFLVVMVFGVVVWLVGVVMLVGMML